MLELLLAVALAVVVVGIVVAPLRLRGGVVEPDDPAPVEETRRGQALLAIKDLDFDHATGKISDEDFSALKRRFTREALAAFRDETIDPAERLVAEHRARLEVGIGAAGACSRCGPRSEPDALYCSDCGMALGGGPPCLGCGATLPPNARFCSECGAPAPVTA